MSTNKQFYVRINLKTNSESFYRCGIKFSRDWLKIDEVDAATTQRLQEEQMLEVSEDVPADLKINSESALSVPNAPAALVAPTDPDERAAAIKTAISGLDTADAALWTAGGRPTVPAIVSITGWAVTAVERDAVWADINKAGA